MAVYLMIFGIHPGVSIHLSTIIRRATCHFQFSSSGRTPMEKSSTGILPKIRISSCRLFSVCLWGMTRDTQLAYPWLQPLTTHKIWLLFALLSILLSGWFTHLLMAVDRRQKALIHLQRNEVQHFLRELQVQLCHLHGTESDHPSPAIPISPPIHTELLHKNIKQYENMIIKINYLLDKLTILKTHPMILYHDYGY